MKALALLVSFVQVWVSNAWLSSPLWIKALLTRVGAIPPLSDLQAQLWILSIHGRLPESPKPVDHYRLHHAPTSRIQYGVDHESYAYQLATDMGSAASFTSLLPRGLKLTLCWALSANVNPKFRLTGPWKWNGAQQVMETEIWSTISRRRGFFGM